MEFVTRQSGVLRAKKICKEMINGVEMKLPLNPPTINLDDPTTSVEIWNLIRIIAQDNPNFQPSHVRLSPTTKKLLIRLRDDTSIEELEAFKV